MSHEHEKGTQEQDDRLKEKMSKIKHALIVMSGKGGVGKTTVAVNLAYALSLAGNTVGILDVDLHGPNIAKMLGVEGKTFKEPQGQAGIEPIEIAKDLTAISIAFTGYAPDQPIIWRGPMKTAIIKQFLSDVNWGDLDYLVIDAPPGTGDEPLSICQFIPDTIGAVIVTTPQDVAVLDARKSVRFAQEMHIPVVGIIENMSGFVCPHCHAEVNIFKKGGGQKAAEELDVPFLGRVPLQPEFVDFGDKGTPFVSFHHRSESAEAFAIIVDKIKDLKKEKV